MAEQVSILQTETSEKDFSESIIVFLIGSGIVLGYIVACFVALLYLLWMITNIYELLVGLSIFYDLVRYTTIWMGLPLAIGFLVLNVLAIFIVIFIIRRIIRAIKKDI
ncbi:MAG: hypothetical protein ACTSPM_12390 [Candidatus Heimdallarchaeota archaeon]